MAKYYAWSDIRNGGKVEEIGTPGGGRRMVVLERNITALGSEITKAKLGVSDEEWDHLIETGSVRPYPIPEESNETISPARAILQRLAGPEGEIDQDMLMELALKHPPANIPPAEEEAEVPTGA